MFRYGILLVFFCAVAFAFPAPQANRYDASHVRVSPQDQRISDEEKEEMERFQNENAHYSFDSTVNDDINDQALERSETRDGTKVSGKYSYSDGFVHRTVHYEADENGYRVVKEETEEIGAGPVFNPEGQADVSGSDIGAYSIKLDQNGDEKHYKGVRTD